MGILCCSYSDEDEVNNTLYVRRDGHPYITSIFLALNKINFKVHLFDLLLRQLPFSANLGLLLSSSAT